MNKMNLQKLKLLGHSNVLSPFFCFLLVLWSFSSARAAIYVDQESDPFPMFEMTVVFPVGFEALKKEEIGVANLIPDILESGTLQMDRQTFLDKLAAFGANIDFTVGNQYTHYSLSFPIVKGKNYDELVQLLRDNWKTPRFEEKTFEISKTKLRSALQASLDADSSLVSSTLRRWINRYSFQGFPVSIEALDRITLPQTAKIFERNFSKSKNIWVGLVAPLVASELTEKILTQVFSNQGKIIRGPYLKKMLSLNEKAMKPSLKREVLIIDKDQRTQLVTSVVAVAKEALKPSEELAFFFGNHILFDSGLASIFADEIRTKRGLAYSVGSGLKQLYTLPVLSVSMNPVREKSAEGIEVLAQLLRDSFENGKAIQELPQDVFDRQLRSFRNSKVLGQVTPASRLAERSKVVQGEVSAEFYSSDPLSWNIGRDEIAKNLGNLWKKSAIVIGFVGEAKELQPLVEKYFPDYKIKIIPYQETISEKSYP
jgi:zinc protease